MTGGYAFKPKINKISLKLIQKCFKVGILFLEITKQILNC